jgi:hypothetical protein
MIPHGRWVLTLAAGSIPATDPASIVRPSGRSLEPRRLKMLDAIKSFVERVHAETGRAPYINYSIKSESITGRFEVTLYGDFGGESRAIIILSDMDITEDTFDTLMAKAKEAGHRKFLELAALYGRAND